MKKGKYQSKKDELFEGHETLVTGKRYRFYWVQPRGDEDGNPCLEICGAEKFTFDCILLEGGHVTWPCLKERTDGCFPDTNLSLTKTGAYRKFIQRRNAEIEAIRISQESQIRELAVQVSQARDALNKLTSK